MLQTHKYDDGRVGVILPPGVGSPGRDMSWQRVMNFDNPSEVTWELCFSQRVWLEIIASVQAGMRK